MPRHDGDMAQKLTPREAASSLDIGTSLPPGDDERVVGYGVIGLPFASGHYLALRDFQASSFGPAYRSVWHRDPAGAWSIYSTAPAEQSCPRYLSSALSRPTISTPIDVTWLDDHRLRVYIDDAVDWSLEARPTLATRLMTAMSGQMPAASWTNRAVMAAMGRMAGPMLSAGRMRLSGVLPNGQEFSAAPQRIWGIADSSASIDGRDVGPIGPLPEQDHLGDFWLPQRGIFFADGFGHFETFDPGRHRSPVGAP
jgi:hypothetical protein